MRSSLILFCLCLGFCWSSSVASKALAPTVSTEDEVVPDSPTSSSRKLLGIPGALGIVGGAGVLWGYFAPVFEVMYKEFTKYWKSPKHKEYVMKLGVCFEVNKLIHAMNDASVIKCPGVLPLVDEYAKRCTHMYSYIWEKEDIVDVRQFDHSAECMYSEATFEKWYLWRWSPDAMLPQDRKIIERVESLQRFMRVLEEKWSVTVQPDPMKPMPKPPRFKDVLTVLNTTVHEVLLPAPTNTPFKDIQQSLRTR